MISDDVIHYYERILGHPSRHGEFSVSSHRVNVLKFDAGQRTGNVTIYATAGMSERPTSGHSPDHRFEIYVGLLPARDEIGRSLAMMALESLANGTALGHAHTMTFQDALWDETDLHGYTLMSPVSTLIPRLVTPHGLIVEFLQAIPAYHSEIAFQQAEGIDALLSRWKALGVAFWDPGRLPAWSERD